MADYRVRVLSSEAAADGNVYLDCWIQRYNEAGEDSEWVLIPLGHRTLVLDGAAISAIVDGAGTLPQKRIAMLALFRAEVVSWGLDEAYAANVKLVSILTDGWPVDIDL